MGGQPGKLLKMLIGTIFYQEPKIVKDLKGKKNFPIPLVTKCELDVVCASLGQHTSSLICSRSY